MMGWCVGLSIGSDSLHVEPERTQRTARMKEGANSKIQIWRFALFIRAGNK
jgi:hypothetical protein